MKAILYPFTIIFLLATVLVTVWFHEGYILGTAEGVLPFYNLIRQREVNHFAWSEYPGLGNISGISIAYDSSYYFLAKLQSFGIPTFIIEALTFWFLLISAGIGIYLLTKELFPKIDWKFNLLSTLFYWFNFISLVNVWNRGLLGFIFFWSLLPFATFLFTRGLNSKNYIYALTIGVVTVIFSLALPSLVFDILLLSLFFYITIFWILVGKELKERIFFIKFFTFATLFFFLIHFWWISQAFSYISTGTFNVEKSDFFVSTINLTTLTSLSKTLGDLIDVFIFKQASFFNLPVVSWATFFNNPFLIIVEFSISAVILLQILRYRKNSSVIFLGSLFIGSIFLIKGNNPPFGEIFQLFFTQLTVLQAFRNPFEKFGFLMPLAAAPLFAVGIQKLTEQLKATRQIIYSSYLLVVLTVFGYPFFTGLVFTNMFPPTDNYSIGYKVKVPEYYEQANQWLKSQGKNFRFIGFPFKDEGITYKWEKGYQGVEPATTLFSTPNLMFKTTVPYYSNILDNLEQNLVQGDNFFKIASRINARYLMVRSDIDFRERNMRDPKILSGFLDKEVSLGKLKQPVRFDKLTFWEFPNWADKTIYPINSLVYISPTVQISDTLLKEIESDLALYSGERKPMLEDKVKLEIVHPKKVENPAHNEQNIYRFKLEKGGDYEVLLDSESTPITVDGKILNNKGTFRDDKKVSFGKLYLEIGDHEINIPILKTENLLHNSAELTLSPNKEGELARFNIEKFNPYSRYLVSFKYLVQSDKEIKISFEQNVDSVRKGKVISRYVRDLATNYTDFLLFTDFFQPDTSADEVSLVLSSNSEKTIAVIKNISVNRLIEPQPVLIKENSKVASSLPQIDYTKVNPTKYKVSVFKATESFILVLSELFNSGWEARFDDNTILENHFLANAYANGWLIEKTGDFNLTLEFAPQRILNIGKIISGVSILGGLMYIGSSILWRKKT